MRRIHTRFRGFLSDLKANISPRVFVFFNTVGLGTVLLGEDEKRSITLAALESTYYRAVLRYPDSCQSPCGKGCGISIRRLLPVRVT